MGAESLVLVRFVQEDRQMMAKKPVKAVDGVLFWRCGRCGGVFPPDGFYSDKRRPNGLKSQCKTCHVEGSIRTRDADAARRRNREWMKSYSCRPEVLEKERTRSSGRRLSESWQHSARGELNAAVRRGKVVRPNKCSRCGVTAVPHGHHEDYSAPLDVVWLCSGCHADLHRGVWAVTFRVLSTEGRP